MRSLSETHLSSESEENNRNRTTLKGTTYHIYNTPATENKQET